MEYTSQLIYQDNLSPVFFVCTPLSSDKLTSKILFNLKHSQSHWYNLAVITLQVIDLNQNKHLSLYAMVL